MICAIVHQLTRNLTPEEIERSGFGTYYVDHTLALWPQAASGMPWTATVFQSKGDPITDLHEDLAAEQKARTTYDNILRLISDPDIIAPIRFLRERDRPARQQKLLCFQPGIRQSGLPFLKKRRDCFGLRRHRQLKQTGVFFAHPRLYN